MFRFVVVLPLLLLVACSPRQPVVISTGRLEVVAVKIPASGISAAVQNNTFLSGRALRSDEVFQRLLTQLRSGDAAKRTCAATDLGYLRRSTRELIPPLVEALRNDRSKWVRRAAAKSLGRIGSREVISPLRQALGDRDRWVAHSAAKALARLRA